MDWTLIFIKKNEPFMSEKLFNVTENLRLTRGNVDIIVISYNIKKENVGLN